MASLLFVSLAGALAGLIHVLSGADHLAAVSVFAARERGAAWKPGVLWGVGHALGAGVIAAVALLLRDSLNVGWISSWGERLVGVTLLAFGFWSLRKKDAACERHPVAALGVGTLHGVSGASHFLGLLPALLLPGRLSAWAYVGGFGVGTVLAMTGFAAVIGFWGFLGFSGYRVRQACSFASIAVGCFWIWSAF